jgi:hypothetical protein
MMKKVKQFKGFVIALSKEDGRLHIFTRDEWSYGAGCRYPEHDADTMQEAIDFIESWGE